MIAEKKHMRGSENSEEKPPRRRMRCVLSAKTILLVVLAVVAVILQINYPNYAIKSILGFGVLGALIAVLIVDER
jgi:polyferredoxin